MARITLFRHAKAETPRIDLADFERTLATRGRRNAGEMGQFIANNGILPDLVIISPATRTRQTHELASAHWPAVPSIVVDSIYEASATSLLLAIEQHGADCENVMVIGHNPGLVVLMNNLVAEDYSGQNMSYFPTCCVADIGFEARTIRNINPEQGRLLSLVRVRDLTTQIGS